MSSVSADCVWALARTNHAAAPASTIGALPGAAAWDFLNDSIAGFEFQIRNCVNRDGSFHRGLSGGISHIDEIANLWRGIGRQRDCRIDCRVLRGDCIELCRVGRQQRLFELARRRKRCAGHSDLAKTTDVIEDHLNGRYRGPGAIDQFLGPNHLSFEPFD